MFPNFVVHFTFPLATFKKYSSSTPYQYLVRPVILILVILLGVQVVPYFTIILRLHFNMNILIYKQYPSITVPTC